MDALQGLAQLPDGSVDLVCTDPPYNLGSESRQTVRHGKLMSTKEAWGRWDTFDPVEYERWMGRIIAECHRILKAGGALYMFTAREDSSWYLRKAVELGFFHRNQVIIVKKNPLPSF